MKFKYIDFDLINDNFYYDDEIGRLRYKNTYNNIKEGDIAGTERRTGYREIKVKGSLIREHRAIYKLFNQDWDCKSEVDHKNNIRNDNRISNLQLATSSENNSKKTKQKNNKSGYYGVSYNNEKSRWVSMIYKNKKKIFLGYFDCPIEAAKIYDDAARLYHGNFAKINFG